MMTIALAVAALVVPPGWHVRAAELNPKRVGMYAVSSDMWEPIGIAASGSRAYVTYSDYNRSAETWENGLLVLDVANPSNPTRLSNLKARWVNDIAARGSFAFVCAGPDGLLVFDASNPIAPRRVRSIPVGAATAVFLAGNYAYVADGMSALVIVDISDPANARMVGRTPTAHSASGVFVSGKFAYVSERFNVGGPDVGSLEIMDVSNPASPKIIGEYPVEYGAWSVLVTGSVAYLGGGNGEPLQVIDVGDPITPGYLGSFATLARGILNGNRVYMYGNSGLEILDVSQPTSPRVLGGYQPEGSAWGVAVSGNHALLGLPGKGVAVIEIEAAPVTDPMLTISRSGDNITLAWPAAAAGFGLETATAIGNAPNWISEPTAPEIIGDQNVVRLEIGPGPGFYRLRKP